MILQLQMDVQDHNVIHVYQVVNHQTVVVVEDVQGNQKELIVHDLLHIFKMVKNQL